jgi:thiamine biosynthesis lipoprotein
MRWSRRFQSGTRRGLECLGACLALVAFTFLPARSEEGTVSPIYKKHYSMGTVYEIVAYDASSARASDAIGKAFEEVDRLDQVMSDYKPGSDLSRLNRSAHFHAESVPRDLYQVMQESLRYSELSAGAFDVTVGPLAHRWKAVGRGEPVPLPAEVEKLRSCVGYRMVELIPPDRIEFHSPCLEVDLGAIGKGYAVDRAVAVLRSFGIERALINAGGSSLYGMGSPPGQPGWLVHLRDPSGRLDPYVLLRENSVSTSEQTPASLLGEKSFGHIIDPTTGFPLKTTLAVSAVAETATASDGLSLTLFLLGPTKGRELVERLPRVAAVWVSPQGQLETASTGPEILVRHASESGH